MLGARLVRQEGQEDGQEHGARACSSPARSEGARPGAWARHGAGDIEGGTGVAAEPKKQQHQRRQRPLCGREAFKRPYRYRRPHTSLHEQTTAPSKLLPTSASQWHSAMPRLQPVTAAAGAPGPQRACMPPQCKGVP